ncbi:hypothetical protein M3Y95_00339700 [Aphelenchoides besseyi]|nr:hypothetical protein M3Y95_00339700 [Aphelenchoides besseyi]
MDNQMEDVDEEIDYSGDEEANSTVQTFCSVCGMFFPGGSGRKNHEEVHQRQSGYKCSCCGGFSATKQNRNNHEKKCHNFLRSTADSSFENAVRIRVSQIPWLCNVGNLFVEVQKTATHCTHQTNDSEASIEEIEQTMKLNPQRQLKTPPCPICGMKYIHNEDKRNIHIAKHNLLDGFTCSLCGIKENGASQRNIHEKKIHHLKRNSHKKSKEAVQISEEVLKSCKQVGTNFADVQRSALPTTSTNEHSALNPGPVHRRPKRASAIELITLDSSDEESQPTISVREPLHVVQPLNQIAHLPRSPKQIRVVEEITLDDSDDDLLPEPIIQTPEAINSTSQFTTPTPRSRSFTSTPQPTTQNRSRSNELMNAMSKKPQVVYYDFKAVGTELRVLPISMWKYCADCELLVLRSDLAHWNGNIVLERPFCCFHLNDELGYFLGFAKPSSQLLANQFKGLLSNLTSFNQLIERMHGMNFRSTLIITNDMNRASIHSLSSPVFIVF